MTSATIGQQGDCFLIHPEINLNFTLNPKTTFLLSDQPLVLVSETALIIKSLAGRKVIYRIRQKNEVSGLEFIKMMLVELF